MGLFKFVLLPTLSGHTPPGGVGSVMTIRGADIVMLGGNTAKLRAADRV